MSRCQGALTFQNSWHYCQLNTPSVHELNCLYTMTGQQPVWITQYGQPGANSHVIADADFSRAPQGFTHEGSYFIAPLMTSARPGALDHVLDTRMAG